MLKLLLGEFERKWFGDRDDLETRVEKDINFVGFIGFVVVVVGAVSNLRITITTPYSYYFGQYSDFLTPSIYLADLGLLLIIFGLLISYIWNIKWGEFRPLSWSRRIVTYETLGLRLLTVVLVANWASSWLLGQNQTWIQLGLTVPLLLLVALQSSFWLKQVLYKYSRWLTGIVLSLVVLEVVLAVTQIFNQATLGLPFHLEPSFWTYLPNVATVQAENLLFIRPYGTFAHPNILAGFLILSLVLTAFWHIKSKNWTRWVLLVTAIIISFGIVLTFSRTALLALLIFCLVLIIFISKAGSWNKKQIGEFVFAVILATSSCWLVFYPLNMARVPEWQEAAISERLNYNQIGLAMFKDNWLWGVGANQSLVHMEQYTKAPLEPWEHQPIHNYFLLTAVEFGVIGFLGLFAVFISIIFWSIRDYFARTGENIVLLAGLLGLFVLMGLDHYFYTLRPGQIMFWGSLLVVHSYFSQNKLKSSVPSDNHI